MKKYGLGPKPLILVDEYTWVGSLLLSPLVVSFNLIRCGEERMKWKKNEMKSCKSSDWIWKKEALRDTYH